jgi:hypothetical protein
VCSAAEVKESVERYLNSPAGLECLLSGEMYFYFFKIVYLFEERVAWPVE